MSETERGADLVDSQLGYWWLPGQPDDRISGSLLTTRSGRHVVQLTRMLSGAIKQLSEFARYPILHGQLVTGQPMSLMDVTALPSPATPDWIQTLYPATTLEGGHLSAIDELFAGALIELPHLVEWLGSFVQVRGELTTPFSAIQRRVSIPVPAVGNVIFAETNQVRVDARGRHESKDGSIFIQLEHPAAKELIDVYVRAIQDMVTFFSGVANPLSRYDLFRPKDEVPPVWRVLEWSEYSKPDLVSPPHHWSEMVMRAEDQLFDQRVIPRWFEIHRDAESSLNQILAFRYVTPPFVDVHFLTLVYGLEGLHRKLEVARVRRITSARAQIEQATATLKRSARKYLAYVLDRDEEPTLEARLNALAAVAGPAMTPLLETFPDLTAVVARARNVMAHQLSARSPIASNDLPDYTDCLRFLAEAYLLRKLGWSEDEVRFIFLTRVDYGRFVRSRGGSLIATQS